MTYTLGEANLIKILREISKGDNGCNRNVLLLYFVTCVTNKISKEAWKEDPDRKLSFSIFTSHT